MDAVTYVLNYVISNPDPDLARKVLDCIDAGLTWEQVAEVIKIAQS